MLTTKVKSNQTYIKQMDAAKKRGKRARSCA